MKNQVAETVGESRKPKYVPWPQQRPLPEAPPSAPTDQPQSENPSLPPSTLFERYCRPELGELLRILALDVEYVRASGDQLTTRDGRVIWDFLGGYGSTILGHNSPEMKSEMLALIQSETPSHAQASARVKAGELAERLNQLLSTRLGQASEKYISLFLSTGTEAVEAAIKHALLSWNQSRERITTKLFRLENGLLQEVNAKTQSRNRSIAVGVEETRHALENTTPVFLALEGSYHGKTAGSLAITGNPTYGSMYPSKAIEVVFLPRNASREQIQETLEKYRFPLGEDSVSFSRIAGCFVEWIQGEGGIHPIPEETAQILAQALRNEGVPLIADEIQTGLYRTGSFLASEEFRIRPDYLLLGKSLGGGYAKISSISIRESFYAPEFGRIHTSTFADDDLSCALALKALQLLAELSLEIQARAEYFESRIRNCVQAIQNTHPGIIQEIRGRGFMLGIEFNLDQDGRSPQLLNSINQTGYALYALSSWLLNRCGIRVAATLNRACTLRLEPSAFIPHEAIEHFCTSLEVLCSHLKEGRITELLAPSLKPDRVQGVALHNLISPPRVLPIEKGSRRKAVFLSHLIDARQAAALDPGLKALSFERTDAFLMEIASLAGSVVYHEQEIEGAQGQRVILQLRGFPIPSRYFEQSIRNADGEACKKVIEAAQIATQESADVIGLGQFTSIVTDNGMALRDIKGPALTTGNSLTVGLAWRAILKLLSERSKKLSDCRVAVIGAAGNICRVYAQLLAPEVKSLLLVHREPLEQSRKFQSALEQIIHHSGVDPEIVQSKISTTHLIEPIADYDVIISGTNSTRQFIESRHLKPGAIVLDIGVPSNIHPSVLESRTDVECFQGGYAALPGNQKLLSPLMPTENGEIFACMAETLSLALDGRQESLSIGSLSRESVMEALQIADRVGIRLGKLKKMLSVFGQNPSSGRKMKS